MRWVSTLVAATLMTAMVPAATGQEGTVSYRLMAYNVGSAANLPLGPRQIGQIADTIIDNAADIVGLAEVELGTAWHDGRDHVAELCVALAKRGYPMHVYKWPAFELVQGWQTPALLSRLPIEESGYDVVPPPGGFRWCVGHITVKVAENTPIRAYMTHFWPQGDPKMQIEAVRKLVSLPNSFDGPCTIMGDFNLVPESNLYPVVIDQGWTSSCQAVFGAKRPSVQGQAGIAGPLPLTNQIDYIFGNLHIAFSDSYIGYFSMSDHWPIVAEVRVKTNGPPVRDSLPNTSATRSPAATARARAAALYRKHQYDKAAEAYTEWEKAADTPDDKGFAAYSAASVQLLTGNARASLRGFTQVARHYANTEWSTRAHYRRAFMLRDQKKWDAAEKAFLAFLDGYYRIIDPDEPKAPTVSITATEIAACRNGAGQKTNRTEILKELAAKHPTAIVARAAAYQLARDAFNAGDQKTAVRYLKQANPSATGLWPHEAQKIAQAYKAAGEPEQAEHFNSTFLEFFNDPLLRRVRATRWEKQRDPDRFVYEVTKADVIRIDGDLSDWKREPAVTLSGPDHLYISNPRALSYDPSAKIYLATNGQSLLIAVEVIDDAHHNSHRDADIWRGDSLQIAIDPAADATRGYNEDDLEIGVALTDSGVLTHKWYDKHDRDLSKITAAVKRVSRHTRYELAVPLAFLSIENTPPARIGLNILVGLSDGNNRLGWLDWTPGIGEEKAPYLYPTLELKR